MSRYKVYARSDMQTVFGERALADTKHVVANVLASSYWTLENRKLSQLGLKAQMAPLMCAAESPLGIILGGNDFDFAAESGRQDASNGELLLPDNSISELPFQLKEAVRDMATVKLATGKHILVVANNNAALQAFALD